MSLADKLKAKKEAANQKGGVWQPQPGDVLEGIVSGGGSTITEYGDVEYSEITTDSGQTFTLFLSAVLRRLWAEEMVVEGDRIAIEFLGVEKAKKGKKTFKNFVLVKASDTDGDAPEGPEETPEQE